MTEFLQQVVAGLASGSIYALLALAIVIIYRSTGVVNFAQGEMATFTTFIAWTLVDHGVGYWGAFALTLLIAFVGGFAVERIVVRPVEGKPVINAVILTIGLFILLGGLSNWIWKAEVRSFPAGGGDTAGFLRFLRPDAVVVDSVDEAQQAVRFARDAGATLVHVSLPDQRLRLLRAGGWVEYANGSASPERLRSALAAGLLRKGSRT